MLRRLFNNLKKPAWSSTSSSSSFFSSLVYREHGTPERVLELTPSTPTSTPLPPDHVECTLLAAPLNPSDYNQIEGSYPIRPPLPAIGGNEGAFRVLRVGNQVQGLAPNDTIVVTTPGLGTWTHTARFPASSLYAVPPLLPLALAATLCVNPPSALRMLEEYVDLKANDIVVQNGANSAVGQAVMQLARIKGVKTVNVIRERPDQGKLIAHLKRLGGDFIVTEREARQAVNQLAPDGAALALNCVGGSSATTLAKCLRPGGTLVTYGGMSKEPVVIPTSLFIFKNIKCAGFWLSGGGGMSEEKRRRVLDRLVGYASSEQFLPPLVEMYGLHDYRLALSKYRAGYSMAKSLFVGEGVEVK